MSIVVGSFEINSPKIIVAASEFEIAFSDFLMLQGKRLKIASQI